MGRGKTMDNGIDALDKTLKLIHEISALAEANAKSSESETKDKNNYFAINSWAIHEKAEELLDVIHQYTMAKEK